MKVKATIELEAVPRIMWRSKNIDDFDAFLAASKSVPGARFRRSDKVWTAPATTDVCHSLRDAFGDKLVILEPLSKWYLEHKTEADSQARASFASDAELSVLPTVAPRLSSTLRPDQRAGVAWVASGYRGAGLIADKPGLGKTMQAIGGVLEADRQGNILVLCPRVSVRNVWWRELTKWTDEKVFAARGTRAQREKALNEFMECDAPRKWLIIVAEMLQVKRKPNDTDVKANAKRRGRIEGFSYPQLFEGIEWDTIIADESHKLLGSLTVAKSNLMGEGLAKLPQPADSRRYAISGTPFGRGGRIQGMFGTLHWLWPDEHTSFWKWAEKNFEIEETVIGRGGKTARKVGGLRGGRDGEAFLKSLGPRILRRTKEEVLPNLPPKQYVEVLCEMGPKQLRQYKQLGEDAEVSMEGGVLLANGVLSEITRAKQIANGVLRMNGEDVEFTGESCKIEALMEKLEARGIGDGSETKVIVSSRYNAFIKGALLPALEKRGIGYHLLLGETSDKKRDEAMDEFQKEGGPSVFVLNSKAGGVSITLDAADEVHCLDEMDNPEDNEQLEDRAHRASRIHQVTIFYYRTEGTYDVNLANSVEDKRKAQFEVLDGRRGLQDVRNWIKYQDQ